MKIKVGVMGSATAPAGSDKDVLRVKAASLAAAIAARDVVLLTGATTARVYAAGKARTKLCCSRRHFTGGNEAEHREHYRLPTDACDVVIHTGFV